MGAETTPQRCPCSMSRRTVNVRPWRASGECVRAATLPGPSDVQTRLGQLGPLRGLESECGASKTARGWEGGVPAAHPSGLSPFWSPGRSSLWEGHPHPTHSSQNPRAIPTQRPQAEPPRLPSADAQVVAPFAIGPQGAGYLARPVPTHSEPSSESQDTLDTGYVPVFPSLSTWLKGPRQPPTSLLSPLRKQEPTPHPKASPAHRPTQGPGHLRRAGPPRAVSIHDAGSPPPVEQPHCETPASPICVCLPRGKIVFADIPVSGRRILNLPGSDGLVFPSRQPRTREWLCLGGAGAGTSQRHLLEAPAARSGGRPPPQEPRPREPVRGRPEPEATPPPFSVRVTPPSAEGKHHPRCEINTFSLQ